MTESRFSPATWEWCSGAEEHGIVIPAQADVIPAKGEVIPAKAQVIPAKADVIPAKAGINRLRGDDELGQVPACAGTTN